MPLGLSFETPIITFRGVLSKFFTHYSPFYIILYSFEHPVFLYLKRPILIFYLAFKVRAFRLLSVWASFTLFADEPRSFYDAPPSLAHKCTSLHCTYFFSFSFSHFFFFETCRLHFLLWSWRLSDRIKLPFKQKRQLKHYIFISPFIPYKSFMPWLEGRSVQIRPAQSVFNHNPQQTSPWNYPNHLTSFY